MAAQETSLRKLLEGAKQYQVPLYQRTYSWEQSQLKRLWQDVVQLAEDMRDDASTTHFIGSLVLAPSPVNNPAAVQTYLVVDGQQRLTTLTLLLCAVRDHRAAHEHPMHRDRIDEKYLTNKWEADAQRAKLVPTQDDRASYRACLDATAAAGGTDRVGAAYRFFLTQLTTLATTGDDDQAAPVTVEDVENAVLGGLAVVSVTAQPSDNVHRIFESLNNTGLKLSQADLLRNYLFMQLPTRGESVYHSQWVPLQQTLTNAELESLFWIDLVHRDSRVKQTSTYDGQQKRLEKLPDEAAIEAEVARFARLGVLLRTVLHPETEADPTVRTRLEHLKAWGTTTVTPLLLHLLERRAEGNATSTQIAAAMLYVESYLVRRQIIGRPSAGLNRTLLDVVTDMDKTLPVDEAVRTYLSKGRKHFATDQAVRAAVLSIPFYLNGRWNQRGNVLRWLEESYASKEPVSMDQLTIEHVLPQTLNDDWRAILEQELNDGETVEQLHTSLVHTLGNLTLTGYNSSLSNHDFASKRQQLATSGLHMNQRIAQQDIWGPTQIRARAAELADRIIGLWPGPLEAAEAPAATAWGLLVTALAALPAGRWTTYGDLAALIGTYPTSVGHYLTSAPVSNVHRVLQADGTVWEAATAADDPRPLLAAEGVRFDDAGRADQDQRVHLDDLAALVAATGDASDEADGPS
ncbi:DUF262 domain-containing protein [Kineococcus sp. NPDC059986]|uniref:GmrSD restriction endonuclease domain-containing protein n=1 Tax=Kineococcus sp. NPDC059986 TaxID=3155538 RepID=UPI00344F66B3